jgi:signal transduction histidine kinase
MPNRIARGRADFRGRCPAVAGKPDTLLPRMELTEDDVIALNRLTLVARVLAGTAHDINNALQIVGGSAEMLAGGSALGDPARRAVDRIQAQATRAAATLQELMQFAQDRGDASPRLALKDVVARALAMRGFAIRRAGLVLDFEASTTPAAIIGGRSGPLLQAVLNLIINAEQALGNTSSGTISVELAEEADAARLRIVDNGRGLDEAIEQSLFEPFVTTKPVPDASGLGLAAARIIARRLGGDVTLEPRSPGCCATLRLPLSGTALSNRATNPTILERRG